MDDVTANKAASVERCIRRIRDEYAGDASNLRENLTKQDSIILNLQRACEACIDLAMHLVRVHRLAHCGPDGEADHCAEALTRRESSGGGRGAGERGARRLDGGEVVYSDAFASPRASGLGGGLRG